MKADDYRRILHSLDRWDDFLLKESGLPGPRGNLELAQVVADEGDLARFNHFLTFTPEIAPVNDPHEFLAFCGTVGLGRLVAEGKHDLIVVLRSLASDPRWRMREATAMALQRVGDHDMTHLLTIAGDWAQGNWLERRAVAAGLAEPRLLKGDAVIRQTLDIFDQITTAMSTASDRKTEEYKILRQGMGYAWSVVVAADLATGKTRFERWCASQDADIRWVMRENLKKNRLKRLDAAWVMSWLEKLS